MRWRGWVTAVILIGFAIHYGCSPTSDRGIEPPIEYDRTTPDNLLNFLSQAYEDKDLDHYDEALDEDFLFQFTEDVADEMGLPEDKPWWAKTEDLSSTKNMFEAPEVSSIVMEYEIKVPWYTCEEIRDDATYSGKCCEVTPEIKVTIEDEAGGEPTTLWVNFSYLHITVIQDRFDESLWTIVRIEEHPKQD
jgi:hypothetical protein